MKYLKYFESNETRYKEVQNIVKDILIDLDDIDNLDYLLKPKNRYKQGAISLNFIYLSDKNLYSKELNDVADKITPIIDRLMNVLNEYGLELGYWRDLEEYVDRSHYNQAGGYVSSHPSEWKHLKTPLDQGRLTKPLKYYVKKYIIYEKY